MKLNRYSIKYRKCFSKITLASLIVLQISTGYSLAADLSQDQNQRLLQEIREREAQQDQNQRLLKESHEKEARQKQKDVFMQEKEEDSEQFSLPQEDISFYIKQIKLEGQEAAQFLWLTKQLTHYQEKNIGIQGVQKIAKQLENSLINRGYITTRIVVPEQDLSTGTLSLSLIVGKINQIRFANPDSQKNWRTAFSTRPGNILNLRHLEQGLEQLKRIQSREVDMQIIPAEQLGMSDIVITAKQITPISLSTNIGDYGSEATGKLQMYNTLKFDNLFNANDILTLNVNGDIGHERDIKGTHGEGFNYSIPDGQYTYTFSRNNYHYHQTIVNHLNQFEFSGESEDYKLQMEKLISRNQTGKTYLEVGIQHKKNRSYIDDTEIIIQRKDTTALNLGLYRRQYINQDILDLNLVYKRGMPWLNAQDDLAEKNNQLPTTHYNIWNLDLTYMKSIPIGDKKLQYRFTFSGQYTKDYLYAAECMSIGNRYTVRGFDGEQTLIGEKGFYVQNELSIPIPDKHQLFMGIDYGCVSGSSTKEYTIKSLLGAVVGLRGQVIKNMQYEIFVGWALKKPEELITAKQSYGFQCAYKF